MTLQPSDPHRPAPIHSLGLTQASPGKALPDPCRECDSFPSSQSSCWPTRPCWMSVCVSCLITLFHAHAPVLHQQPASEPFPCLAPSHCPAYPGAHPGEPAREKHRLPEGGGHMSHNQSSTQIQITKPLAQETASRKPGVMGTEDGLQPRLSDVPVHLSHAESWLKR